MLAASMTYVLNLSTLNRINFTSARKPAKGDHRNTTAKVAITAIAIGALVYCRGLRKLLRSPIAKCHSSIINTTFECTNLFLRQRFLTFFSKTVQVVMGLLNVCDYNEGGCGEVSSDIQQNLSASFQKLTRAILCLQTVLAVDSLFIKYFNLKCYLHSNKSLWNVVL